MSDQDPQGFITSLSKAVEDQPTSARAHMKLGTALSKVGRLEEATQSLRRAVDLDASLYEAWVNLGGILFSRWDFPGSAEANRRAVACNPDAIQAHYNLGLCHLYQNQAQEMLNCFQRVVELDPQHGGAHYHMAVALNALGDAEAANAYLVRSGSLGFSPEPELIKSIDKALKKSTGGTAPAQDPARGPSHKPLESDQEI